VKIRFFNPIVLELTTKEGKVVEKMFNNNIDYSVLVVENNPSFETATIHFSNGETAYGVPLNTFDLSNKPLNTLETTN